MNTYNILNPDDPGTILYHAIAESEMQVKELAEQAGIDLTGMIIENERMNIRPLLGVKDAPIIIDAIVR